MPNRAVVAMAAAILMTTPALAAESVQIDDLVIASPLGDQQGSIVVKAARAFHDFWKPGTRPR